MKQLFLALILALPLQAAETLRLFIWSEYIDPAVVADFEKANNCKVTIDLYEDADALVSKVQSLNGGTYDVAVPSDFTIKTLVKLNLLSPLDHKLLPNFKNLDPKFQRLPFDPENKFTVAYQWATLGIYARANKNETVDPSWSLIFDPKKQLTPFTLLDSPRDTIGAALKFLGYSLNSTKPAELRGARDLLIQTKKRALGFENTVGGKNKVLSKSARAAVVFSGEGARGTTEDTNTVYMIPKEGTEIGLDNLVILANAPNKPLAHKFINYLLEGKVAARNANFTQFSTANAAAKPFIDPALLNNPTIYPTPEVMEKLEFLDDLGPAQRLYDEVWTQIKTR